MWVRGQVDLKIERRRGEGGVQVWQGLGGLVESHGQHLKVCFGPRGFKETQGEYEGSPRGHIRWAASRGGAHSSVPVRHFR